MAHGWATRAPQDQPPPQIPRRDDMRIKPIIVVAILILLSFAPNASAQQMTRDIKVISSAGARALVDSCVTWAQKNNQVVAIAILDWGGNLIESHAMEGAAAN